MEQLWTLALIALVAGPLVAALVYGLRHPESGRPAHDDATEAQGMIQFAKDHRDMRSGGRGW